MTLKLFKIKKAILFIILIVSAMHLNSQNIKGNFSMLKGQTIRLFGFNGLKTYVIDSAKVSQEGKFTLKYSDLDIGIGFVDIDNKSNYTLILGNQNIQFKGKDLGNLESIKFFNNFENNSFQKYAFEKPSRLQALNGWYYLQKLYNYDPLFTKDQYIKKTILSEINRINKQDSEFLYKLSSESYLRWYLEVRILINSTPMVGQFRPKEINKTINEFRKLNYNDRRLYKSGLIKDVIESQFWLLENRGLSIDSIYLDINISSDSILKSISKNENFYNEIADFLFDYFEKHSLFFASEHLALNVLNQNSIHINKKLSNKLEQYRKMKNGSLAKNILFSGDLYTNGIEVKYPSSLSDISAKYKLIIFGASWCPMCTSEMTKFKLAYPNWKSKGVEVIFISLDTDKTTFSNFVSNLPFLSFCDYQKWETLAAKDYYVFSSPTYYLLDHNNKIIAKPISFEHISAFIDFYGNDSVSVP